jgi:hypothetical protein
MVPQQEMVCLLSSSDDKYRTGSNLSADSKVLIILLTVSDFSLVGSVVIFE